MIIRFQADNDLKFAIVKAVRRREPAIDFASAQESGLDGLSDLDLLDRAASDGRVMVSHDLRTMLDHFRGHLAAGKTSPGLLLVSQGEPIGEVVDALVVLWAVTDPGDLTHQAYHLPSFFDSACIPPLSRNPTRHALAAERNTPLASDSFWTTIP